MNIVGILFSFVTPACVVLYMIGRLILNGDDVKPA